MRTSVILAMLAGQLLFAKGLTKEQKKELYKTGTVTVYNDDGSVKGHFEVSFMPGKENVDRDAKKMWKESVKTLGQLVDKETFWKGKVGKSFMDGLKYIKDRNDEKGLGQIKSDYNKTKDENSKADDNFGKHLVKTKNWLKFGGKFIERSFHSLVGLGVGMTKAVVCPIGHVVYVPVAAGTKSIVRGSLVPALRYTWNGTAWVIVQNSDLPEDGDMTVTFVPEELPANNESSSSSED
tara:strand:+ start:426 stop:1136 length:711 start_codon:yes stop_codon:yes gene_type:complete